MRLRHAADPNHSIPARTEAVASIIVDAALAVHRELGAGLYESLYQECLAIELRSRGLLVREQVSLPVFYHGVRLKKRVKLDMIVDDLVLVELKSVDAFIPADFAQVITYLHVSGLDVGLLANFHVAHMKEGIRRFVPNRVRVGAIPEEGSSR